MKGHINVHRSVGGISRAAIAICLAVLLIVFLTAYSVGSSTANPRIARLLQVNDMALAKVKADLVKCEETNNIFRNGDKITAAQAIEDLERREVSAKESLRLEKEQVASLRSVVQQCRDDVAELRTRAFGAAASNITAHLADLTAKRAQLLVQHEALTNITEVRRRSELLALRSALVQQLMEPSAVAERVATCAAHPVKYSVVFDLGSSGNRVHVYRYEVTALNTDVARDVISKINLTEELFELNHRALSRLPNPVEEAPAALRDLFDKAKAFVPANVHHCTPVEFKATAGLRMLGPEKATEILAAIRRAYLNETFWMRGSAPVRILDGSEEGPMAWLTVNFLLGAFSEAESAASVAVIDLGGGSTQVVFEPDADAFALVPTHQQFTATLGSRAVKAYQHSYEGFGLHSATRALLFHIQGKCEPKPLKPTPAGENEGGVLDRLFGGGGDTNHKDDAGNDDDDDVENGAATEKPEPSLDPVAVEAFPCFAVGYEDPLGVSNTKITEAGQPVTTPNFTACVDLFKDRLLKPRHVPCPAGHCGIGSIFQPPFANFTGDIYAFSFIFDLLDVANATALAVSSDKFMTRLPDLAQIGTHRCEALTLASIRAASASGSLRPAYDCMYYAYVYALLRYGYGISDDRQLHVAKKIRSFETAWTLGASLISLA